MAWGTLNTGSPIGTDFADLTVITDRLDNLETGFTGSGLSNINIDGGYIDGTPIGGTSPGVGAFTSLVGSTTVTGSLVATTASIPTMTAAMTFASTAVFASTVKISGNVTMCNDLDVASTLSVGSAIGVGGNTGILWKPFTGTLSATGTATVAHGLTAAKVVGINVAFFDGTNYLPIAVTANGYIDATNLIINAGLTGANRAYTACLFYIQ